MLSRHGVPALCGILNYRIMKTRLKLWDGRKVTVEQTMTSIRAKFDDEPEARTIDSREYMGLVISGVPCSE